MSGPRTVIVLPKVRSLRFAAPETSARLQTHLVEARVRGLGGAESSSTSVMPLQDAGARLSRMFGPLTPNPLADSRAKLLGMPRQSLALLADRRHSMIKLGADGTMHVHSAEPVANQGPSIASGRYVSEPVRVFAAKAGDIPAHELRLWDYAITLVASNLSLKSVVESRFQAWQSIRSSDNRQQRLLAEISAGNAAQHSIEENVALNISTALIKERYHEYLSAKTLLKSALLLVDETNTALQQLIEGYIQFIELAEEANLHHDSDESLRRINLAKAPFFQMLQIIGKPIRDIARIVISLVMIEPFVDVLRLKLHDYQVDLTNFQQAGNADASDLETLTLALDALAKAANKE